jgi:hypothetical protein
LTCKLVRTVNFSNRTGKSKPKINQKGEIGSNYSPVKRTFAPAHTLRAII